MKSKIFAGTALALTSAFAASALPAGATGSIAGGDTNTRQVGHAFGSCTAGLNIPQSDIYGPVRGVGAVVGQAFFFGHKGPKMSTLLGTAWAPAAIFTESARVNADVNASDPYELRDTNYTARQYEILSLDAPSATFSGSQHGGAAVLPEWGSATTGNPTTDRFVAAAAFNTLTNSDFADVMTGAFAAPTDIVDVLATVGVSVAPNDVAAIHKGDLAERLFIALASGFGRPGEGDTRCVNGLGGNTPETPRSVSDAWVRVDNPLNANPATPINLRFRSLNNKDAVRELAKLYFDCRMNRGPCTADVFDKTLPPSAAASYSFTSNSALSPLGKGQSIAYNQDDTTITRGYDGRNYRMTTSRSGDAWTIVLTPPRGEALASNTSYPVEGGARNNVGAIQLTRNGVSCAKPHGDLKIDSVTFSGTAVTRLRASFDNVTCQDMSGDIDGVLSVGI